MSFLCQFLLWYNDHFVYDYNLFVTIATVTVVIKCWSHDSTSMYMAFCMTLSRYKVYIQDVDTSITAIDWTICVTMMVMYFSICIAILWILDSWKVRHFSSTAESIQQISLWYCNISPLMASRSSSQLVRPNLNLSTIQLNVWMADNFTIADTRLLLIIV